jgi:D-alanyl-lipoteichoic acid acyltransferase DltB (MBOAT superfamily)
MEPVSPSFLLFALAAVLAGNATRHPGLRRFILLWSSLVFGSSMIASSVEAVPFVLFVLAGYAAVYFGAPVLAFAAGLAATLYALGGAPTEGSLATAGLAFVVLRVVHLAADRRSGALKALPGPAVYLGYVLFFPTFLAGPFQRYDAFAEAWETPLPLSERVVFEASSRVVTGLIKLAIGAAVLVSAFELLAVPLKAMGLPFAKAFFHTAASAAVYALLCYATLSGLTDVAIGIARLLGFALPENFDRPLSSVSALDLLSRWHVSVVDWFRAYVAAPLEERIGTAAALFAAFFLMGVWHRPSIPFLVLGLWLGAGVAANALYRNRAAGLRSRLKQRWFWRQLSRGLALAWLAVGLSAFWLDATELARLAPMLLASFALLALAAATASAVVEAVIPLAARFLPESAGGSGVRGNLWLGSKVFALVLLVTLLNRAADLGRQPTL